MPITNLTERVSIGALIRQALGASPDADPTAVVESVIDSIDPADYRIYLDDLIRARLSTEVNRLRADVQPRVTAKSTKRELLRSEWWPAWLSQRIVTADGSYLFLRDASPDHLRFAAATRREQAAGLVANAVQFEHLADAMERAHVVVLRDLSPADAAPVLERAA